MTTRSQRPRVTERGLAAAHDRILRTIREQIGEGQDRTFLTPYEFLGVLGRHIRFLEDAVDASSDQKDLAIIEEAVEVLATVALVGVVSIQELRNAS